jgi:Spy/CpxP family protein refolding chaperone
MKSAYELAMSRLEQSAPSRVLTEEQKAAIREIDSEYDAKVAERRIFLESEIIKSHGDSLAAESLRKQLASELTSIEEKREKRKKEIRKAL